VRRLGSAFVVLAPTLALANSLVPANDFGAVMNAFLFPLVILVEWLVYRAHGVARPLRGAVVSNVITSAMGFVMVFGAGPLLPPLVSVGISTLGKNLGGVVGQALLFPLFHFCVTLATEQGVNLLLNRPKAWPFSAVLRANAVTYGSLMAMNAVRLW
jgi:hypothetical protein